MDQTSDRDGMKEKNHQSAPYNNQLVITENDGNFEEEGCIIRIFRETSALTSQAIFRNRQLQEQLNMISPHNQDPKVHDTDSSLREDTQDLGTLPRQQQQQNSSTSSSFHATDDTNTNMFRQKQQQLLSRDQPSEGKWCSRAVMYPLGYHDFSQQEQKEAMSQTQQKKSYKDMIIATINHQAYLHPPNNHSVVQTTSFTSSAGEEESKRSSKKRRMNYYEKEYRSTIMADHLTPHNLGQDSAKSTNNRIIDMRPTTITTNTNSLPPPPLDIQGGIDSSITTTSSSNLWVDNSTSSKTPGGEKLRYQLPYYSNTNENTTSHVDQNVHFFHSRRHSSLEQQRSGANNDFYPLPYHGYYQDGRASNASFTSLDPMRSSLLAVTINHQEQRPIEAGPTTTSNNMITLAHHQDPPSSYSYGLNTRPFLPLGIKRDKCRLSRFLCFLRAEFVEVFEASEHDIQQRGWSSSSTPHRSQQVKIGQVGIRCRFCAHLTSEFRVARSWSFPSNISGIYQCVSNMIYKHFTACQQIPKDIMEEYKEHKKFTKKGDSESKSYWTEAAKELGMMDQVDEKIIVMVKDRQNKY